MIQLPQQTDIAVIGAGPAGSTLAAALAGRGRHVTLFERDRFPRDKVCGEFLSPESLECFRRLGLTDQFLNFDPPPMERARLTCADGTRFEVDLPAPARGLSRKKLDSFLFDAARDAGATCVDGTDVRRIDPDPDGPTRLQVRVGDTTREVEADVVVAAWGRRSRLDRQLDRPFFENRSPYVGLKRHHRVDDPVVADELAGFVELHAFDGGYCGVSFVEDGVVNVCTMVERRLVQRDEFNGLEFWKFFRRGDTPLARRLQGLTPCVDTDTQAVAQIPLTTKQLHAHRGIVFVGDAAGMIAPLTGDGQAMAMESALKLAEMLDEHLPRIPGRRFTLSWRRRYEPRLRLGQVLQPAMNRPAVATAALKLLRRFPAAGRQLVRWTRGG